MTVKLIQIGNSRGIRIPKTMLRQAGLEGEANLEVRGRRIIIEPAEKPRAGWDQAFAKAVAKHGAALTEEDKQWLEAPNNFDDEDWTW